MKTFINARLILRDGVIQKGFLKEDHGKIISCGLQSNNLVKEGELIDCKGLFLAPGFIDMHVHGGGGFDYMDGTVNDICHAARAHLVHGTTSTLPTTLTSSDDALYRTIDCFKEAIKIKDNMPNLLGLHLEGPYFSPTEKGAQPDSYIKTPSPEHYMPIIERGEGWIKRWSVAPELPGALEMADRLVPMGIMIAAAHTAATYDEMRIAYDHGFSHLTHFYSGMSSITRKNGHRILGVVEAGYLIDGLSLELIADGIHLPPDLLKMILKLKNHDKICLCTDGMRGAGMPDGPSILGPKDSGVPCIIADGVANMMDRSGFAGSIATTDRLVRTMCYKAGLPVWEAVKMASYNVAHFLHIDDHKGSIAPNMDADLVIFDDDIKIYDVYVNGKHVTLTQKEVFS